VGLRAVFLSYPLRMRLPRLRAKIKNFWPPNGEHRCLREQAKKGSLVIYSGLVHQKGNDSMANTPEEISPALARQLIRDGNTDRLNADPRAVDKLNQSVIEEFRVNKATLGVRWRVGPSCYLR
jgi:hypothetical protein